MKTDSSSFKLNDSDIQQDHYIIKPYYYEHILGYNRFFKF